MPLHERRIYGSVRPSGCKHRRNGTVSAMLVNQVQPGNSLEIPDKIGNRLHWKPDNLQIVVQAPTWPRNRRKNGIVLSAKLVKIIPPRNSPRTPDKIENHLLSKPDNLQIVMQEPTWPRKKVHRNVNWTPTFKIFQVIFLSTVTIHTSNKHNTRKRKHR
ncbi:hypothetical protein H5410_002307 [Solanum commersonii]|uniref:Uncharacterized protein n=1 Tax=Solanum commersonii TaxID=4109 RepID=A0A9J6B1J0_SOLCO|nr:hypothetical protein H5410_002307 [Solanum commersonii]